jgi:hypothetical protein
MRQWIRASLAPGGNWAGGHIRPSVTQEVASIVGTVTDQRRAYQRRRSQRDRHRAGTTWSDKTNEAGRAVPAFAHRNLAR